MNDEESQLNTPEVQAEPVPQPQIPRLTKPRRMWAAVGVCLVVLGVVMVYGITQASQSDQGSEPLSFFSSLRRLAGGRDSTEADKSDDQVNVLLLGIGGPGHEGSMLTDTMIIGRYQPSTGRAGLISVPRDLGIMQKDGKYIKLNAVHAYAEQAASGSGPAAIAQTMKDIFGTPIDTTIRVDFRGFAQVIDAIGGVDVEVDRSFTDPAYPVDGMEDANCDPETAGTQAPPSIPDAPTDTTAPVPSPSYGCRFETLSFTKGPAHMEGALALKFARSRHGNNTEGSDFARAARQQKIILAVKDKLMSPGVFLNPAKLSDILGVIKKNVTTDLSVWKMIAYAKDASHISWGNFTSAVIDGASGLVYQTNIGGAYMLLPVHDNWADFRLLATNLLNTTPATGQTTTGSATAIHTITSAPLAGLPVAVGLKVEIQNGTTQVGIAAKTAQILESSGITVTDVGNAESRTWSKTTIYDMTGGTKPQELVSLAKYFHADVVNQAADAKQGPHADFLIIIGDDFGKLVLR